MYKNAIIQHILFSSFVQQDVRIFHFYVQPEFIHLYYFIVFQIPPYICPFYYDIHLVVSTL